MRGSARHTKSGQAAVENSSDQLSSQSSLSQSQSQQQQSSSSQQSQSSSSSSIDSQRSDGEGGDADEETNSALLGLNRKRRRRQCEIQKDYTCHLQHCGKSYGCAVSLAYHLKVFHELPKADRSLAMRLERKRVQELQMSGKKTQIHKITTNTQQLAAASSSQKQTSPQKGQPTVHQKLKKDARKIDFPLIDCQVEKNQIIAYNDVHQPLQNGSGFILQTGVRVPSSRNSFVQRELWVSNFTLETIKDSLLSFLRTLGELRKDTARDSTALRHQAEENMRATENRFVLYQVSQNSVKQSVIVKERVRQQQLRVQQLYAKIRALLLALVGEVPQQLFKELTVFGINFFRIVQIFNFTSYQEALKRVASVNDYLSECMAYADTRKEMRKLATLTMAQLTQLILIFTKLIFAEVISFTD